MSQETGIGLVCTNDVHYTYADDVEAHDVLLCIQTGKKITDEDRMRYEGGQFYVKSEDEMRALFPYAQEAVDNTQKIADRCHVTIEFGNYKIPKYEVPEGYASAYDFLKALCDKGFEEKYTKNDSYTKEQCDKIYRDMEYELGIIEKMGFVEYILIVWAPERAAACAIVPASRISIRCATICFLSDSLTRSECPCPISTWTSSMRSAPASSSM